MKEKERESQAQKAALVSFSCFTSSSFLLFFPKKEIRVHAGKESFRSAVDGWSRPELRPACAKDLQAVGGSEKDQRHRVPYESVFKTKERELAAKGRVNVGLTSSLAFSRTTAGQKEKHTHATPNFGGSEDCDKS